MSSRSYRRSRDDRSHRDRPRGRSPQPRKQRDQWSKPTSRRRTSKNSFVSHHFGRQTVRQRTPDFVLGPNVNDIPMEIGSDDSDSGSLDSNRVSESSSDHNGTPIPDHVWVGEYLDEGEDNDTVPLPYDAEAKAKDIAYKKALLHLAASSGGAEFASSSQMLQSDDEYSIRSGGSAFPRGDADIYSREERLSPDSMPPPMPRIGVTDTMPTNQALRRYDELYKSLVDSMEYRAELERKRNELMQQSKLKAMPAIYDYGHGEKRASTSRHKRERRRSTEKFSYDAKSKEQLHSTDILLEQRRGHRRGSGQSRREAKSQELLRSATDLVEARSYSQSSSESMYKEDLRRRYDAVDEPIPRAKPVREKSSTSGEASTSSHRLVIPVTKPSLLEELFKLQNAQNSQVPVMTSSRSVIPTSRPLTYEDLHDIQKTLIQPSSVVPGESDENYIPVRTSFDRVQKEASPEGFPIKVLTTSHRSRQSTRKDEEEFPHVQSVKSSEGRQPIAQVTPLRIKPILKKVNRDVKSETSKRDSAEGSSHQTASQYPKSSTFRGSFNDTRKVLLDAAKELESRSSTELFASPRIVVSNTSLTDSPLRSLLPPPMPGRSPEVEMQKTKMEFTESLFPFHKSFDDSGKKSDDSDEYEAETRRFHRRHSKNRSPVPRRDHHRHTKSPSPSRNSRYQKKVTHIDISDRERSRERDRYVGPRLLIPPDKSGIISSEMSRRKQQRSQQKDSGMDVKDKRTDRNREVIRTIEHDCRSVGSRSSRRRSLPRNDRPDSRPSGSRRSPARKTGSNARSREDGGEFSDRHLAMRNVDKGSKERSVSGRKQSPLYRQVQTSLTPENHSNSDSARVRHVRSRDRSPQVQNIRISISPHEHRRARSGRRHDALTSRHQIQTSGSSMRHNETDSNHGRRVLRPDDEHSPGRSDQASHSAKEVQLRNEARPPRKRQPHSETMSIEGMAPNPPKRGRKSSSPPWADKRKSKSPVREVRRHPRYEHEAIESIIQNNEIPRLLDVDVAPLQSLMDVDVSARREIKSGDERRFASRSTSREKTPRKEMTKTTFKDRQMKKIITNPTGKITLKRQQDVRSLQGKTKAKKLLAKAKEKVLTTGKVSGQDTTSHSQTKVRQNTTQLKSGAKLPSAKEKQQKVLPAKVKTELVTCKPAGGAETSKEEPPTKHRPKREFPKAESTVNPAISKTAPKHREEWFEDYMSWFQQTLHEILQGNERARQFGLQEPVHFLENVTRGDRRSLSFVPRGEPAKEMLKFIALNKKAIEASGDMETHQKNIDVEKKNTSSAVQTDEKQSSANSLDEDSSTSSHKVEEDVQDGGNGFFMIDKKPTPAQIQTSVTKKTDDSKKAPTRQNSSTKGVQMPAKKKAVKRIPHKGVLKRGSATSPITSKPDIQSKESPKPAVHHPKSCDPVSTPLVSKIDQQDNIQVSDTLLSPDNDFGQKNIKDEPKSIDTDTPIDPSTEVSIANEPDTPNKTKFRSWQDALLFGDDDDQRASEMAKDSGNTDIPSISTSQEQRVTSIAPQIEKECSVTLDTLFESAKPKSKNSTSKSTSEPAGVRPSKFLQQSDKEADSQPSTSKVGEIQEALKTAPAPKPQKSILRKKPVGKKDLPQKKGGAKKGPAKVTSKTNPARTKQSNLDTPQAADNEKVEKPMPKRSPPGASEYSRSAKHSNIVHDIKSLTANDSILSEEASDISDLGLTNNENPPKTITESSERRRSRSSGRRRESQFNERLSTSRRKSTDNPTARSGGQYENKTRSSRKSIFADRKLSRSEKEDAEIPSIEPTLTPEQESLLPAFKRQVEKSVLRSLNILYKLEIYKKYKVVNAADDALQVFKSAHSDNTARFTLQHALYYIRCLFETPTKDALDNMKRQLRNVDLEEPCFQVDLSTFFLFQKTAFGLCRRNLNHQVRYASQDGISTKYVRLRSQYHFPQFDGEAHIMMKMWTWRERMFSVTQNNTVHSSSTYLKPFPDDHGESMEELVAKWLKQVTNKRIYDLPEASNFACDLVYEVKRQLMKRKAHATRQEAIILITRAWMRNYYYSIEKSLLANAKIQEPRKISEASSVDELMVLDEVYSDESDSGGNTEELDIDISEDLTGVEIELF